MSPAAYPTDWNAMSLPALFDALCRADAEDAVTRALREDLGVALAIVDVDGVVARLGRHVLDDVLVVEEGRREQVRLARVLLHRSVCHPASCLSCGVQEVQAHVEIPAYFQRSGQHQ